MIGGAVVGSEMGKMVLVYRTCKALLASERILNFTPNEMVLLTELLSISLILD